MIGHDSKAKEVCLDGLSASLVAAGVITPVLATVVGRSRPTVEEGAFSFHPFRARSFPSGHTTQVFAVVSVIATSYDQLWVKITAYGAGMLGPGLACGGGSTSRPTSWPGALIGTAVGRSIVHYNRRLRSGEEGADRERGSVRLSLFPLVDQGAIGVAGTLGF